MFCVIFRGEQKWQTNNNKRTHSTALPKRNGTAAEKQGQRKINRTDLTSSRQVEMPDEENLLMTSFLSYSPRFFFQLVVRKSIYKLQNTIRTHVCVCVCHTYFYSVCLCLVSSIKYSRKYIINIDFSLTDTEFANKTELETSKWPKFMQIIIFFSLCKHFPEIVQFSHIPQFFFPLDFSVFSLRDDEWKIK